MKRFLDQEISGESLAEFMKEVGPSILIYMSVSVRASAHACVRVS